MTELAQLGGNALHPYIAEDILRNEGGMLRRRGKVMYASDFESGFDGWIPVFNKGGGRGRKTPPFAY